jgi:hypothetical protein
MHLAHAPPPKLSSDVQRRAPDVVHSINANGKPGLSFPQAQKLSQSPLVSGCSRCVKRKADFRRTTGRRRLQAIHAHREAPVAGHETFAAKPRDPPR